MLVPPTAALCSAPWRRRHAWDTRACRMYHKQPEAVFGPHVDFREYSFLWNQAAKPLNASMVTIVVCKVGPRVPTTRMACL